MCTSISHVRPVTKYEGLVRPRIVCVCTRTTCPSEVTLTCPVPFDFTYPAPRRPTAQDPDHSGIHAAVGVEYMLGGAVQTARIAAEGAQQRRAGSAVIVTAGALHTPKVSAVKYKNDDDKVGFLSMIVVEAVVYSMVGECAFAYSC